MDEQRLFTTGTTGPIRRVPAEERDATKEITQNESVAKDLSQKTGSEEITPSGHTKDCAWQLDQYSSECTCGASAYRAGIEAAARVAREQEFYPDTHTGMRQQWVKDQIEAKILALAPPQSGEPVAGGAGEAAQFIQAAIDTAPEPLRRLGEYLSRVLDEDRWATVEPMLLGLAAALAEAK